MEISAKNNFSWLLGGILTLLLLGPLVEYTSDASQWAYMVVFTGTQIVGVWSLVATRKSFMAGIGLMVLGMVLYAGYLYTGTPELAMAFLIVFNLFCILTITIVLKDISLAPAIERNTLIGAISVYLLLGVIWTVSYIFLSLIDPGAFGGLVIDSGKSHWSDFIYFSFVTLTTLGYGDITPVSSVARTLVYMEAVVGQLYITIMIAGLVGLHFSTRKGDAA